MQEYILCNKKESPNDTVSTDDIIKIFESSNDLNLLRSLVEKAQERIYLTWATVVAKDSDGEQIPIDKDFINKERIFVEERGGPINDEHTNANVGRTLAFKVLQHPKTKTTGILHLNKIYNHNVRDDQVWKDIVSGKKTGSSVGGFVTELPKYEKENDGSFVRSLMGFEHYETSAVEHPANPLALNESYSLVAKSNTSGEKIACHNTKEDAINQFRSTDTNKKKMVENKKKADMLDQIMAKVANGQTLSDDEMKTLTTAVNAGKQTSSTDSQPDNTSPENKQEDAPMPEDSNQDSQPPQDGETPATENTPSDADSEKVSELEDAMEAVMQRLDQIESVMSGGPTGDATDKKVKSDEPKEETNNENLEEKVKSLEKENLELKKQLETKQVIKSERPGQGVKNGLSGMDVALGKARYNPKTGQIEAK